MSFLVVNYVIKRDYQIFYPEISFVFFHLVKKIGKKRIGYFLISTILIICLRIYELDSSFLLQIGNLIIRCGGKKKMTCLF